MDNVVAVSHENLAKLSQRVAVPSYERSNTAPRIVHFGVGGFHRAHQAVYAHELLENGSEGWPILGAGVLPRDTAMRDALHAQDCLYTLVEQTADQSSARVIGSIVSYLYGPDDPGALLASLTADEVAIVSLTVTEGGYYYDFGEKALRTDEAAIQRDIATDGAPVTWLGYVVRALSARRKASAKPFTVMSCDNIPHNGDVARQAIVQFAEQVDPELARFIAETVRFPSTMVDRITPATTDSEISRLESEYGIRDQWPVFCESFRQWVVEDEFPAGRPAWEAVGAQLVGDVYPYELAKIRLLNGAHSALAYVAYLIGYRRVDRAVLDADIRRLVRGYMEELKPTLPEVPGWDLDEYCTTLIRRFENPAIADQVARLALDGSTKIANSIAPGAADAVAAGGEVPHVAFAIAGWIRYCEGSDEDGQPIEVADPQADRLKQAARRTGSDSGPFLDQQWIFPRELAQNRRFRDEVGSRLDAIRRHGTRAAMAELLRATP